MLLAMEPAVFAARRARLAVAMGPRSVAVFAAPPEATRSQDTHYKYRPSSDIVYLTGFVEPECVLVMRPGAEKDRVIMFVRPRDPERETWDGRRAGVEGAVKDFGADAAYPIAELAARLPGLIGNCDDLHYALGLHAELDARVCAALAMMRMSERRAGRPPKRIVDPRGVLHEMRLHKGPEEIALLRRAGQITRGAFEAAMRAARPGVAEYELEALLEYEFRRQGAVGPGYGTIVGTGRNATILHYIECRDRIAEGDLVLIDAGAELDYYTADVTRTFPAGGRFSPLRRKAYEVVLTAQLEAIAMIRPGVTIDAIHERTVERLVEGMVELGLLAGEPKDRITDGSYKKYYMHRTSHWLGMDVHDVGAYAGDDGNPRPLAPGMVITIEPGLYVPEDDQTAPAELRGVGIRIEDDILVTESGHDVLTAGIPKTVDEVERLTAASASAAA
jgi:Xaa-Pro aminopeptidase